MKKAKPKKRRSDSKFMTKEARERLNRVRIVKPAVAESVELAIMQAIQAGAVKEPITDSHLRSILDQSVKTKEFNIKIFKRND